MNEIIKGMIDGYLDGFSAFSVSEQLQSEIDDYKIKLIAFAKENNDVSVFYQKFTDSGLQEEYMNLMTKVTMASIGAANADGTPKMDYSDHQTPEISVADFVEQYRIPYQAIKETGYRKRGEAAYEAIFAVAEQTTDMLEAQLILEKERLLWNIIVLDSLDIFEPILAAMDPLQTSITENVALQIEAYKKAQSEEELMAFIENTEQKVRESIQKESVGIAIAATISKLLLGYCKVKLLAWQWEADQKVQSAIISLISLKKALRRTLTFMKETLGKSYQDFMKDEGMKIWMLNPNPADSFGRIKTALHPNNFIVYQDIIENEIEKDISIKEILTRRMLMNVHFDLDDKGRDDYNHKAEVKAKELNADLIYYQYTNDLEQAYQQALKK